MYCCQESQEESKEYIYIPLLTRYDKGLKKVNLNIEQDNSLPDGSVEDTSLVPFKQHASKLKDRKHRTRFPEALFRTCGRRIGEGVEGWPLGSELMP